MNNNIVRSYQVQSYIYDIIKRYNLGEICRNGKDSGTNYACKRIENCESLREEIRKQNYPDICSFNGSHPIVCCSPTTFGRQKNHNIANESTTTLPRITNKIFFNNYNCFIECRQYWELVRNAGFTFRSKMTKRNTDVRFYYLQLKFF